VATATVPGHAQTDLTAANQAVSECVVQVRRAATLRENYDQFGRPPMWRNFDAFLGPDGRVHENGKFVGEQDGVYLFEKCLANRGFSVGSGPPDAPKPSDTCTQQELDVHAAGDCWIKLSRWEKRLAFIGLEYGWLHSFGVAERQQYNNLGKSNIRFLLANFDIDKAIAYFDSLYGVAENRNIIWDDAFDLLFRTQANPATKDIPGLIALYRRHFKPLFSGYLQKFVPPNKVVISESRASVPAGILNETITLTLLGVSADKHTDVAARFMAALLNIKACNTLIRQTDAYKEMADGTFYPQLAIVIQYPLAHDYQQEEFFNGHNELSGIVLLNKEQSICAKKEGRFIQPVRLGELMLEGAKDQNEFSAEYFQLSSANDFIDLNRYLVANMLVKHDDNDGDPRQARQYYGSVIRDPTPDGVTKILKVGSGP
jgi:hypothetical protein